MTKTPLKVSHCVCDCPAKPSGRQLQQHNKWSVRDYPGTISGLLGETLTKQACRAPFFFCSGAIWVTHWSDWTTTIKASGFPQFSHKDLRGRKSMWKSVPMFSCKFVEMGKNNISINLRLSETIWKYMKKQSSPGSRCEERRGLNLPTHACSSEFQKIIRMVSTHVRVSLAFNKLWCAVTQNSRTNIPT